MDKKVYDYRFCYKLDDYDLIYDDGSSWSRPYEYKYITNFIEDKINFNQQKEPKIKIHNTSWGFEGVHIKFRDNLDQYGECLHSDIVKSEYRETYNYNITEDEFKFHNNFDFVINVSTIEHLSAEHQKLALMNLYKQVKVGGYLLLTFDYPRVPLNIINDTFNLKIKNDNLEKLNGNNSIVKNEKYGNLNIVFLTVQKGN